MVQLHNVKILTLFTSVFSVVILLGLTSMTPVFAADCSEAVMDSKIQGWMGAEDARGNAKDGGFFRHYENNASIYCHTNTGAVEIHGLIRVLYSQLNWEWSFLGYPTTDELTTPDGVGRFNHFEGGSIYWHPNTGAHEVHGLIKQKWSELGWETSFLGYPTTDELDDPNNSGGKYTNFEGGVICWDSDSGIRVVEGGAGPQSCVKLSVDKLPNADLTPIEPEKKPELAPAPTNEATTAKEKPELAPAPTNEATGLKEKSSSQKTPDMPPWFKNNANWWRANQISENDMVNGIENLVEQDVIKIDPSKINKNLVAKPNTSSESQERAAIPNYVKDIFGFWADGLVTDTEVVNAIQHLVNTNVIKTSANIILPPQGGAQNSGSGMKTQLGDLSLDLYAGVRTEIAKIRADHSELFDLINQEENDRKQADLNIIPKFSVYEREGNKRGDSLAYCDIGDVAVGGGFGSIYDITSSKPAGSTGSPPVGWSITDDDKYEYTYVACLKIQPHTFTPTPSNHLPSSPKTNSDSLEKVRTEVTQLQLDSLLISQLIDTEIIDRKQADSNIPSVEIYESESKQFEPLVKCNPGDIALGGGFGHSQSTTTSQPAVDGWQSVGNWAAVKCLHIPPHGTTSSASSTQTPPTPSIVQDSLEKINSDLSNLHSDISLQFDRINKEIQDRKQADSEIAPPFSIYWKEGSNKEGFYLKAQCNSGDVSIGGGFSNLRNPSDSRPDGESGWQVSATSTSGAKAVVVCLDITP